ncbi:MAG: type I glutamate--ammonia ligase [candidate division Zixibacteria bacterium]|nr:type I glutamate--ammonia ligase [candidate division Zixibacteria bacterium]
MFRNLKEVLEFAKKKNIEMVDLKYGDLFGRWHHLSLPASQLDQKMFKTGIPYDGSSTPGFKSLEAGDMVLLPDISTAQLDPFWEVPTLSFICSSAEADNLTLFPREPRYMLQKTKKYLLKTGIADKSMWAPEFEFYIFDNISYKNDINMASYIIDSNEADWNSGLAGGKNLGHKIPPHGGYEAIPPLDDLFNIRSEMVSLIEKSGIRIRYHHHEVGGPGQSEIEIMPIDFIRIGDVSMWIKYLVKMVAKKHNHTVTFMPKPLYNEAGNGMHFHQYLLKKGKPLFYDKSGYAGLSKLALYYIGGLLTHGPALLAFTNPSTNSYKRLVPGFEAPVKLFFSLANRSATIRIPKYAYNDPMEKRVEFRPADASCNVYLAVAAQLLAGLDGIKKKIDPVKAGFGPIDKNIFLLPANEKAKIKNLPSSLKEALDALEKDCDFLLSGNVFSEDLLETWIDYKLNREYNEVRNRPHPYEINLYYDV